MSDDDRIVRIIVTGLVQGVGYRAFVEDEARRLRLAGWVRNRRDRSVEAVAAGPGAAIGELLISCRRGPAGALVEAVDVEEANVTLLGQGRPGAGFSVLPTV